MKQWTHSRRVHIVWIREGERERQTACGWGVDIYPKPRYYTIPLNDNDEAPDWCGLRATRFREDPDACKMCLRILTQRCSPTTVHVVFKAGRERDARTACGLRLDASPKPQCYTVKLDDAGKPDWYGISGTKFRNHRNPCKACMRILAERHWCSDDGQ